MTRADKDFHLEILALSGNFAIVTSTISEMTKSEGRMSKEAQNPNDEIVGRLCQTPRRFAETPYNYFVIISSFVIRASSLFSS
jgi:hypothetical protein